MTSVTELRGTQDRDTILQVSARLFLLRGYAETSVGDIVDACRISRADFDRAFANTYEIFKALGQAAYEDVLPVLEGWDRMSTPCSFAEVRSWVRDYFDFMEIHGAFIFASTQSAPAESEFGAVSRSCYIRIAFILGNELRARQAAPTDVPEVLGLSAIGTLHYAWAVVGVRHMPVDEDDIITNVARTIYNMVQ